jgi:2-amino-4-hydroxy-6-hydroxymethyldihydropteridine diphosphokinase
VDLDIVVWNDKLLDPDFYEREYLKKAVLELMPNLKY